MDLLLHRYQERESDARERAARLLRLVSEFGDYLYGLGAVRVTLFGSLATGKPPHGATDIDLAVEGLDEPRFENARQHLESRMASDLVYAHDREKGLDLVRWETASESLRRNVLRDGKVLPHVSE